MGKHAGIVSRCRLGFDRLEERALLSGGNPGLPGPMPGLAPPPTPQVYSEPPASAPPIPAGAAGYQANWPRPSNGSPPSPLSALTAPEPPPSIDAQPAISTQPQRASESPPQSPGTTGPVSAVNSPSDPAVTAAGVPVIGPVVPSSFNSPGRAEPAPGVAILSSLSSIPGSMASAVTVGRGPSGAAATEPDGSGAVGVDTLAADSAITVGKEFAEEGGAGNSFSIGPAAGSLPAQPLSLLGGDHGGLMRVVSPGEGSHSPNSLTATSAGQSPESGAEWSRPRPTAGAETARTTTTDRGLEVGALDEWPGPSGVDLIAGMLPFNRAALDRAIERFFHQMEDPNPGGFVGQRPAHVVFCTLALACTFAALDVINKRRRQARAGRNGGVRDPLTTGAPVGFPELPGSWISRLS